MSTIDAEPVALRTANPGELEALVAIDDATSVLFSDAGLHFELPPSHPFVRAESERWGSAIASGRAVVAVEAGAIIGFAVCRIVDGAAYLDQLSVHPQAMRRGVGTRLLHHAIAWAGGPLWLTTYAHLSWNGPYYARHGFVQVPEAACGPELRAILADQRAALPRPASRVAMRRGRA